MNNLKKEIIKALESEIDFKGKKALRIIHNMKEESRNNNNCNHLEKNSGLLTPPDYNCIPFSQCKYCGEYFFSINFIEKILTELKKNILAGLNNKINHNVNFYK